MLTVDVFRTLSEIASTSSRKSRIALLRTLKDSEVAHFLFDVETNSGIVFAAVAVEDAPDRYYEGLLRDSAFDARFEEFKKLVGKLSSGRLVGKEASDAIELFLRSATNEHPAFEARWYAQAINRNLRIGLPDSEVCGVWPDLSPAEVVERVRSRAA